MNFIKSLAIEIIMIVCALGVAIVIIPIALLATFVNLIDAIITGLLNATRSKNRR